MKYYLMLLMLLPLALVAQQYSLDELIGHGLEHGWSIQRAGIAYESSRSSLSSAKWNLLPDVDLNFGIRNDFYHPLTPGTSDLSSSAGIALSKTISLNDADWFNYKYAQLDEKKAALSRENSSAAFAYSVFSAYLDVLSAQKQLASLQKNLEIQSRVWEQSKVLNRLGKNTTFDVKQSEIAVMNSRISIIQLENTIGTKRRELFGLIQKEDEGFALADLAPTIGFQLPVYTEDSSNEIKLLQSDIRRSELSKKQNSLDFFPRVNLAYNLSRSVGGEDFDFDQYNTSHTVSLNLSYSLWNHFKQSQSAKRSDLSLRLVELDLLDRMDSQKRQYQLLEKELQYLQRLDELYTDKLSQSAEQIAQAEERYKLGLIDILELDKTRVEYIDSDISYNNNRYQILAKQEAINHLLSLKLLGKW